MNQTFKNTLLPIVVGADHAGFEYKEAIKQFLVDKGFQVVDKGTYSLDSVDYPDFAHPVASQVEEGKSDLGILICGSGNGVCFTANKHQGIRAILAWQTEIAKLGREHNNANVLCLPARFVSVEEAKAMVDIFLETPFEGGRHERRVEKVAWHESR